MVIYVQLIHVHLDPYIESIDKGTQSSNEIGIFALTGYSISIGDSLARKAVLICAEPLDLLGDCTDETGKSKLTSHVVLLSTVMTRKGPRRTQLYVTIFHNFMMLLSGAKSWSISGLFF